MGVAIAIDPFQVVFVFFAIPPFFFQFSTSIFPMHFYHFFVPFFFCHPSTTAGRWVTGTSCPTPTMMVLPCRMPINISRNVSRISTGSPHRKSSWVDEIMRCGFWGRISDQFPWLGIRPKMVVIGWESQGQI